MDVNVLIALAWPNHLHHGAAQTWFERSKSSGFRTCPITQLGFLRISCNPKVTSVFVSPASAHAMLETITRVSGHEFWPDDLPCARLFEGGGLISGPKQFTDRYLVALAESRDGMVATLDRPMYTTGARDRVEWIDA